MALTYALSYSTTTLFTDVKSFRVAAKFSSVFLDFLSPNMFPPMPIKRLLAFSAKETMPNPGTVATKLFTAVIVAISQ